MAHSALQFNVIADRALAQSETLLTSWLPDGKLQGREYVVRNPTRQDDRPGSFKINVDTGLWLDGATGDQGGDLISLYAYLNRLDGQLAAAKELGESLGIVTTESVTTKKKADDGFRQVVDGIPDHAPPLATTRHNQTPTGSWAYHNANGRVLGYVLRFDKPLQPGDLKPKKDFFPLTLWTNGDRFEWRYKALPTPRPLFNLHLLARNPQSKVVMCEGEACCVAAGELLQDYIPTCNSGGSHGVANADLSPLRGRDVLVWPDADEAGEKWLQAVLVALKKLGCTIAVVNTSGLDSSIGYDAKNALHDGLTAADVEKRIELRADNTKSEEVKYDHNGKPSDNSRNTNKPSLELKLGSKGEILPRTYNLSVILENDTKWQGVIAYNDFRQRIEKRIDPPYKGKIGDWMDKDTVETRVWLDQSKDVNFSKGDIDQVVMMIAHRKSYNPAQDALRAMADQWDNQSRINSWLVDYLNAECDELNRIYLTEIGSCWLKGVAARVLMPGCKRDDVLVLKGEQGFRKSTAASVIADAIHPNSFTDTLPDLKSEEVKLALHGMIIVEFAELAAINKSEIEVIKNFVTSQVDHVRGKYAHYYGDYPRTVSFIGTTNDETFLKDPTGNRRWWPVKIASVIDTDLLRSVIRQLLGEAAHRVIAGEPWHVTNDEAHRQAATIRQDSFQDDVWKDDCISAFHRLKSQIDHIQTADILREMGIKIEQHSKAAETRVSQIMRSSGYEYKQAKRNYVNKKAWITLEKVKVSSTENVTGYQNDGKTSTKTSGYPGYPEVSSTLESFKGKEATADDGGLGGDLGGFAGKEYETEDTRGYPGYPADSKGKTTGYPTGYPDVPEDTFSPVESDPPVADGDDVEYF